MNSVLVMRFSGLGDVAITLPVIKSLEGKCKIIFLTRKSMIPLFSKFENIEVLPVEGLKTQKDIDLFCRKMKNKVDLVADLHGCFRSKIISRFLNKETKGIQQNEKTQIDKYVSIFNRLGLKVENLNVLPGANRSGNKSLIGFAPGSIMPFKRIEPGKVIEIIKEIQKSGDVLLFGHPKENELGYISKQTGAINTADLYSFQKQLEIIPSLDVMISADSANGHLAANYGIPVITLWEGTTPENGYTPFKQPMENSFFPSNTNNEIIERIWNFL